MKIIQTKPGATDFRYFEALPKIIYPSNNIRHKQTEHINTTYLDSCYVLLMDDEPKARLCIYNNPELSYHGRVTACLGNYECVDEPLASEKILETAINKAKQSGFEFLIGPMNGSTWDQYRFSLHNDAPTFLLEPYHHVYYNHQFTQAGFEVIARYKSRIDRSMNCNMPEILKAEESFIASGLHFRRINMALFEHELDKLYPFISEAFRNNFLYTPIKRETFFAKYLEAAPLIHEQFFLIAEDDYGHIAGFIFSYPDLYNRDEPTLVIKTLAREASPKWKGLGYVLINKVMDAAKKSGYKSVIHAFMIDEGKSTANSNFFFGKNYKQYALYGIAL